MCILGYFLVDPLRHPKITREKKWTWTWKGIKLNVKNGNLSLVRDVSKVGSKRTHKRRNKCTHHNIKRDVKYHHHLVCASSC